MRLAFGLFFGLATAICGRRGDGPAAAAGAALEMSLQDAALRREWPRVVAALAAIREENA